MTQFEFVSVAVSIVLALSAARLLAALPHLLDPGRAYWVHALWALLLLPSHLSFWWAVWSYRDIEPWTYRGFAALMLTPALLFLVVNALVTDSPAAIGSWRAHFYARRRVFFSLYLATMVSIPLRQWVVLGDVSAPVFEAGPVNPLVFVIFPAIAAAGLVASGERFHATLIVFTVAIAAFNMVQM